MTGLCLWFLLLGCGGADRPIAPPPAAEAPPAATPTPDAEEAASVPRDHLILFKALVAKPAPPADKTIVELGRTLWFDPRLSASQRVSCQTCHQLQAYGVDGRATSMGGRGAPTARNTPTVFHAADQVLQFWDGAASDLEAAVERSILDPTHLGMIRPESVVTVLAAVPGYQTAFAGAFPDKAKPLGFDTTVQAIATFVRHLRTLPGPFDAYLGGELTALDDPQRRGLDLFVETGCTSCHNDRLLGGYSLKKLGAIEAVVAEDRGREAVTGDKADRHVFKVPGLRNVAMTGPWLHDGSMGSLEDTIRFMVRHQLGKTLTDDQVADIAAFLGALTGKLPLAYMAEPPLPRTGPDKPPRGR